MGLIIQGKEYPVVTCSKCNRKYKLNETNLNSKIRVCLGCELDEIMAELDEEELAQGKTN